MGFFESMEAEAARLTRRQTLVDNMRAVAAQPLTTDELSFHRGISTMGDAYPWMQAGAIISAAMTGLDATQPESRRLAALAAVDKLASPLGLRDAAQGASSYSFSPTTDQLARTVASTWDQITSRAAAGGTQLSNLDAWRQAVRQARRTLSYGAAPGSGFEAADAPTPFEDPNAFVSNIQGGILQSPGEMAPLGAQKNYARQEQALGYLSTAASNTRDVLGVNSPREQRRLVENAVGTLTGERPLTPASRSSFIDRASPEERMASRAAAANSYPQQQRDDIAATRDRLEERYGNLSPDSSWTDEDYWSYIGTQRQVNDFQTAGPSGDNPLAPIVRTLGVILSAPLQLVTGGVRNVFESAQNQGIGGAFMDLNPGFQGGEAARQTDLGLAANEIVHGRDVDLGGGYFVDPDSAVGRQRYLNEISHGNVGGHAVTVGRLYGGALFEPDTLPFDLVSGFIDAGVAIRADPANPLMDQISESAGLLNGSRKLLSAEDTSRWLQSDDAVNFARLFADTDPEDTTAIYRIYRNSHRNIPYPILNRLVAGEAGDTEYVLDVLRGHAGLDLRRLPAHPLDWTRRRTTSRLAAMMPHDAINIRDPDSAIETVERYYTNIRAPEELIARRMSQAADMFRPRQVAVDLADLDPATAGDIARTRAILRGIAGEGPLPDDMVGLSDSELSVVAEDLSMDLEDALTPVSRNSLVLEPDRNAWYDFATDVLANDTDGLLQAHGVPNVTAKGITRLWHERSAAEGTFWVDDIGEGRRISGTRVGDEWVSNVGPHLTVEHLNSSIPLPDARKLRRMTANPIIQAVISNPKYQERMPLAALNWAQDNVWKTSVLLRLAWPARVIGEEQLRMGASGIDSMFHSPISYISWVIGRKGGTDIAEDALAESHAFRLSQASSTAGWVDSTQWRRTGEWGSWRRVFDPETETWGMIDRAGLEDHSGYTRAWAEEIGKLHADPVASSIARIGTEGARYENLDEVTESLWHGPLQGTRADLERTAPYLGVRRAGGPTYAARMALGDDRLESLDDWVESIEMRVHEATGGSDEILDTIRTGSMDVPTRGRGAAGYIPGVSETRRVSLVAPNTSRLEAAVTEHLGTLAETHGPKAVAGAIVEASGRTDRVSHAVESMFSLLMGRPTNYLSRSPAFRQFYWKRVSDELIGFGTRQAQDAIVEAARAAGLDATTIATMTAARNRGFGMWGLEELDAVAKGHALDDTKNLLYDLSERSQFFDAARLVFPFGEAWKEVLTRWGDMVVRQGNLRPVRRLSQVIGEARQNTAINEHAPGDNPIQGEGFFWKNNWDEEVFIYPGSQWLTDKFLGVPIPLTGRAQGLSLASEVYPGLGLAVQLPAQFIMGTKPHWGPFDTHGVPLGDTRPLESAGIDSTLRDLVLPFGERSSAFSEFVPPAWRTFQLAFSALPEDNPYVGWLARASQWVESSSDSDRAWGSTVADIARYLYSTGDYNIDDPDDQERAWRDAADIAPGFFLIRALGQFSLPSSPAPEFLSHDQGEAHGTLVRTAMLTEDWNRLVSQPGVDYWDAFQQFIDLHGEENRLVVQPKTDTVTLAFPLNDRGFRWVNAHADVEADYPATFGLAAPPAEDPSDPDFSSEAWRASFERGDRTGLTADENSGLAERNQMRRLDQHRIATLRFRQAEEFEVSQLPEGQTTLPDEAQARLDRFKSQLRRDFPGYGDFVGLRTGVDNAYRERLIGVDVQGDRLAHDRDAELRAQSRDPRLDARYRGGLRELLQTWDYALGDAASQGYSSLNNEAMAPVRRWLRYEYMPGLRQRNARVGGLIDFVFDPMLDEVDEEG